MQYGNALQHMGTMKVYASSMFVETQHDNALQHRIRVNLFTSSMLDEVSRAYLGPSAAYLPTVQ